MKIKIAVILTLFSCVLFPQENPVQGRLLARRAAIVDAQRVLTEMIHGITLGSMTTVQDLITTDDAISGQLGGLIRGAEIASEDYKDQIYTIKLRIEVQKLKALLGQDFQYDEAFVEAIGKGAPKGGVRVAKKITTPVEAEPERNVIQAKGYGAMPNEPSMPLSQKQLLAERAAKLDAYRNLLEQIKGVQLDSQTTVQDLITEDDTILTNIEAFIRGARIVGSKLLPNKAHEVIVEISLDSLKAIIE
jgi:hypothetical protein